MVEKSYRHPPLELYSAKLISSVGFVFQKKIRVHDWPSKNHDSVPDSPLQDPSFHVIVPVLLHVSHSLNSLKGNHIGDYIGDYYRGY